MFGGMNEVIKGEQVQDDKTDVWGFAELDEAKVAAEATSGFATVSAWRRTRGSKSRIFKKRWPATANTSYRPRYRCPPRRRRGSRRSR